MVLCGPGYSKWACHCWKQFKSTNVLSFYPSFCHLIYSTTSRIFHTFIQEHNRVLVTKRAALPHPTPTPHPKCLQLSRSSLPLNPPPTFLPHTQMELLPRPVTARREFFFSFSAKQVLPEQRPSIFLFFFVGQFGFQYWGGAQ